MRANQASWRRELLETSYGQVLTRFSILR
ncbi:hypothethical protein (plasmid) [Ralstonia solanacearum CMR15]|nr:hypothethical protein [Ralstonia solanacearum CMR15]